MKETTDSIDTSPDSLSTMLRMAHSFKNWDNLIRLSDALYDLALNMFNNDSRAKHHLQKPLVYYLGFSSLMKGLSLQKKKLYQEALLSIENYQDLSLFSDGSEQCNSIVDRFKFLAETNRFSILILSGDNRNLDDYAQFIQRYPSEILPGFITILEHATTHNIEVDEEIVPLLEFVFHSVDDEMNSDKRSYYFTIFYLLAIYNFKNTRYQDAVEYNLKYLECSDKTNDDQHFKKAVALHEEFRAHASSLQLERYNSILKNYLFGVIRDEEGFSLDSLIVRNS
ncbi:hypothetical protein P4H66_23800 [Paenibacillus dokdonensis]|uniref:DNA-binding protein n=1 Tax=Paenibacillus dokdonensis TaxID=2567944 RepID=A0ABU6GSX2_9BACL|nr:hypothetical protein [Paenibacillus dokdonensis]MEC0242839.1 hypothetical protein [Paenibacillus dokdonensis]